MMQQKHDSTDLASAHARALEALAHRNRLRTLSSTSGADFSSNDYLGLANAPELKSAAIDAIERGVPIGATGSRLLRGNHPEHEALEAEAASHFRSETALFMGGGFQANYAIFATLPQRGDLIVFDELIHASVHDGMKASQAERKKTKHNDPQSVNDIISKWRADGGTGRPWIAVESLYSMDGDRAPLADLANIARQHDAYLIVDEAHATGVFGPQGRGFSANLEYASNIVTLHTCGKALGAMGGLICGPKVLGDFLVNRCRPLIYATAPSPLIAAIVRTAIKLTATDEVRRDKLANRITDTGANMQALLNITPTGSQIQPIIVGSDLSALTIAAAMQTHGFDVRAIRPPTVPANTARLRITLNLNTSQQTTNDMIDALSRELERTKT